MMLVPLIGPLLWGLLRRLGITTRTWLGMLSRVLSWVLSRVLSRVLRTVWLWLMLGWLLRIVSVGTRSLVFGSATCLVVISSASS